MEEGACLCLVDFTPNRAADWGAGKSVCSIATFCWSQFMFTHRLDEMVPQMNFKNWITDWKCVLFSQWPLEELHPPPKKKVLGL